jgi:hypothetical protein
MLTVRPPAGVTVVKETLRGYPALSLSSARGPGGAMVRCAASFETYLLVPITMPEAFSSVAAFRFTVAVKFAGHDAAVAVVAGTNPALAQYWNESAVTVVPAALGTYLNVPFSFRVSVPWVGAVKTLTP